MDPARRDRLVKPVASPSLSRRSTLGHLGGAALALLGFSTGSGETRAQEATAALPFSTEADAQAGLDALDPDTRDSLARAWWLPELRAGELPPPVLAAILHQKNSNEAFGLRMGARLLELLAAPVSFVPDGEDRYTTLLPFCASLSPHQAYVMTDLLGPATSQGYFSIPEQADLQFPAVNSMRLDAQVGWYFFVGSCHGADGAEYGVELMFFRYALLPPAMAAQFDLNDTENQVVELHFAISKAGDRHYQAKPIVVAGTTGLLEFSSDALGAALGKNRIRSLQAESVFPLQLQAWGRDDAEAEPVELEIDFTFTNGNDYLLQGVEGCSPCCDGVGTLYYSIPDLQLDPSSTLRLRGEEAALTSGTFWFDHQWGMLSGIPHSAVLRAAANTQPPALIGWDWFEAQFEGNQQITCAAGHTDALRRFYFQTGPTPPGTMQVPVKGKYMDPTGTTHGVTGSLAVTSWIRSTTSPAPADYPVTDTWYPNRWEFAFGRDVPEEIRTFTMEPIVASGQSGFFANGAQYSEGAVYLRDGAGNDIGRGFAESVSYADTLKNRLRLAGLPVTAEMLTLFQEAAPSEALKLASEAYVALHADELNEVLGTCRGL